MIYGAILKITAQDVKGSMRHHLEVLGIAVGFHPICDLQYLFVFPLALGSKLLLFLVTDEDPEVNECL